MHALEVHKLPCVEALHHRYIAQQERVRPGENRGVLVTITGRVGKHPDLMIRSHKLRFVINVLTLTLCTHDDSILK